MTVSDISSALNGCLLFCKPVVTLETRGHPGADHNGLILMTRPSASG